ncbi:MAG: hypothetical protein E6I75_10940, partial [Chloroflexi bacterium]
KFVLNKPNPRWWATTLTSNHGIVEQFWPEAIFKDQDPVTFTFYDPAKGWPIGTGPYKLVQATAQQKVFDLNPSYWGAKAGFKPLPKIQRVIFLPAQDDTLATQRLINNELDMCKIVPVPTLKSAFAQNAKIITFSGQDAPYGYTDWCPISLGFNNSAAPFDKPEMRQAINFAIDRTKLVNLAESGAGVLAFHQFTPYVWFQKFDQAIQPTEQKYGLDGNAHPDKVGELMGKLGFTKGGDGLWADQSGEKPNMKVAVPDWLKNYGPPLTQQLRDAGFDASFDTSPGLDCGREGHGPLLHAVDLHVAVLPTDWPASPDLLGDVSLPQLRLRRRRRQDQPPQRRRSQNAGLLHSGDGPVVQGHADGLRLAVDHPLPDEHHLLDRLAVQRQALRLSAFLAAGAHEDDLYFATNRRGVDAAQAPPSPAVNPEPPRHPTTGVSEATTPPRHHPRPRRRGSVHRRPAPPPAPADRSRCCDRPRSRRRTPAACCPPTRRWSTARTDRRTATGTRSRSRAGTR